MSWLTSIYYDQVFLSSEKSPFGKENLVTFNLLHVKRRDLLVCQ